MKFCLFWFLLSAAHLPVEAQTDLPYLSFESSLLNFSVTREGSTENKTSTLSTSDGSSTFITLTKPENTEWLVLPADAAPGSLSFGVNSSGLAPGEHICTVTASAAGYTDAQVNITLEVINPALSFSPASLTFNAFTNGSANNQYVTLSANTGAPEVTLSKSENTDWLILPSATVGSLSFGINAAGLSPGTYTSKITAAATGYESASLEVTLIVTTPPVLLFSPTSLSFSVVQNGSAANQTADLSTSDFQNPNVTLSKTENSDWLLLPSATVGSLSFGINTAHLAPGTYTSKITASATGYESASLEVTLIVTSPPVLLFSPTSLSFSVVRNGSAANQTADLSTSDFQNPNVTLSKTENSDWLLLPSTTVGSLSFGINAANLAPGTYTSKITASADGYKSASLEVTLVITEPPVLSFSPESLSFSVVQNSSTPSKSANLTANAGSPAISLFKTENTNWLILPSAATGSLSFGINSAGLSPGNYTSTVTASASGYASATLQVSLTVTAAPALSFSPASVSFSVVQNGSTVSKSATLSANTGSPAVSLAKSANSNWLVLPSAATGSLSFGINAAGLSPGNYTSTVTASASGYASATLQVSLTVTVASALSFSPATVSFSVVQNGSAANKSATLSANTGSPTVLLAKSVNSNWLVLPSAATGSLSFGVNSAGLSPGNYTSTVTASASGYASATLQVSLTVTVASALSFSPATVSFSVVQNGSTANKSATLSANTGSPTVLLAKSANSNWLVLPSAAIGSLSFGVNSAGLSVGNYTSTVTASASGYASATLQISLTVNPAPVALNIKVNFQDSATVPATGWLRDFGQSYGSRTSANQGSGYTFGWLKRSDKTPLSLTKNGRKRTSPSDVLLATFMHMQADDITTTFSGTRIEGIWEVEIANGKYDVSVSVGDGIQTDSKHFIRAEGVSAIKAFAPSSATKFKSASVTVTVTDGRLTIDADTGTNTKINWITIQPAKPAVVSVNPRNNATNVSENSSISTDILKLPNGGINNSTITSSSVYLIDSTSGALVSSNVNGTGGGDAITLVPSSSLKLNTTYKFNITAGVKDLSGASFVPYTSTFKITATATPVNTTIQFDKVSLPTASGRHSNLTIGPDGKLYAVTIDGIIKRFSINSNGTLSTPQLIYSLQDASGTRTQRLAIGFAFDPSATATNLIAWVTHSTYMFLNGPDWDGKLTKLSGADLQGVQDVVVNLPRSAKDHLTNSIAFGPDGALYFTQGSNSAMGRADQTWSNRNEHLLSGSVLRLDPSKVGTTPLNAKTSEGSGTYNPYATNAPLTIYASGVRNAYDLVWHSNGSLYVPTNGSAAGGNTPASVNGTLRPNGTTYNGPAVSALTNVQQTQNDFLFRVVKGGFYGHPNPLRGEYVMNGGNPTSGADKAEVTSYPVGTKPDSNWRGNAFNFKNNCSPNGVIEYKSNTFNGALKGKLLVVRYSQHDDIITLTPGSDKNIASSIEGNSIAGFSGFVDPLDLVENTKTGTVYVSEYGGDTGKITLLRPRVVSAFSKALPKSKAAFVPKNNPNTAPGCDEESVMVSTAGNKDISSINSYGEKPKVNPNPVTKRFTIEFPKNYEGDFAVQIIDPLGRIYNMGKKTVKAGGFVSLDISNFYFSPGIYFLKIESKSKTDIIKLIKQ